MGGIEIVASKYLPEIFKDKDGNDVPLAGVTLAFDPFLREIFGTVAMRPVMVVKPEVLELLRKQSEAKSLQ